MTLYEDNLSFIKKHNAAVFEALAGPNLFANTVEYLPETDNYRICRDGMEILLHSEYSREREFERLLRPLDAAHATVVLFGIGNGQILDVINKRFPDLQHLIVVEPNPEIMRGFLARYDFVESFRVFNKASFIIGLPPATLKAKLEELVYSGTYAEKKIVPIASVAYRTLYADYFNTLVHILVEALRFFRVNKATLDVFRLSWMINNIRNLKHAAADIGVFRDAFAGMPAVIVSAGPSLSNNVHLLKEVKDRALIVAVGSAISILESRGIVPHLRVALDGTVENKPLFEKVDTAACPLLFSDHLYFEILDNYKGPKVRMIMRHELFIPYLLRKAKIEAMPMRSGFSVANVAMFMLLELKCSKIILMGQDLCYSRGKLHAEGSWDENDEDKWIKKQIETVDIHGNPVYTDKAFLGMKKIFETVIADHPSVRFINASEGGLAINGADNVHLADLLTGELAPTYPITEEIARILQAEEETLPDKAAGMDEAFGELRAEVEKILDYCRQIDEKYMHVYKLLQAGVGKKLLTDETRKLRNLFKRLHGMELYDKVVKPILADKIGIRREAVDYSSDDFREQWAKELGLLRLEMQEIYEYVGIMHALIQEYQGERKLNIVFQPTA